MIDVASAEKIVLDAARTFGSESVDLLAANGRILAEDIYADRDYPPYDRIMMDGYAIAYADFAGGRREFEVLAIQAAGSPAETLSAGSCIQVMTGAVLPTGADTIIPVEDTEIIDGKVRVNSPAAARGQFIHRRAADTKKGDVLISAGRVLSSSSIPLAAAAGCAKVMVSKLPSVAMITTGDELVEVDKQPEDYQIRQSNNFAVAAVLGRYGITLDMRHADDDIEATKKLLTECMSRYDVVIISGGVSKGAYDYVPGVLADLGADVLFHGVAQKPGKPLLFATHGEGCTIFAFPGNPVSTMLCLHKYLLPWLKASLGATPIAPRYAVLDEDIQSPAGLRHFTQASLWSSGDGVLHAKPIQHNGSGDFTSLVRADVFIDLPAEQALCKQGEAYQIIVIE